MTAASRRRACKAAWNIPPTIGGVEWGGGAIDPVHQIYVVNNSYTAQIYQLLSRKDYDAKTKGKSPEETQDYFPQSGTPFGVYVHNFFNWLGMAVLGAALRLALRL